jgi:hypothetical protein
MRDVQVVLIQTGVFVAILQLESAGAASLVAVTLHPHLAGRSVPLWTDGGTQHANTMWGQLSALAMQALAFYTQRAEALGASYPGAEALQDLLLWLVGFAQPRFSLGVAQVPLTVSVAAKGAESAAGSTRDAAPGGRSAVQARSEHAVEASTGRGPASLLSSRSLVTQRLLTRDHETQAFLPPVWRPYQLPREVLVCIATGNADTFDFLRRDARHLDDVPVTAV